MTPRAHLRHGQGYFVAVLATLALFVLTNGSLWCLIPGIATFVMMYYHLSRYDEARYRDFFMARAAALEKSAPRPPRSHR